MSLLEHCIVPDWPAPPNVRALQTTRIGGVSNAPFDSLNLASHVEDAALTVSRNRMLLAPLLPSEPVWLKQVHGATVADAAFAGCWPEADACVSSRAGAVCVVLTADCLPLLLCDASGSAVGAVHAGWRGLCGGVIEATVGKMKVAPTKLMAWLGPAIGPWAFEVGEEVRTAFVRHDLAAQSAFSPHTEGKYLADLYALARQRLHTLGVTQIYGGDFCTYSDQERFFSFRRDGVTGRMASLVWLAYNARNANYT